MKSGKLKKARRAVLVVLVIAAVSLAVVVVSGGGAIRWLGGKSGKLGNSIKDKSVGLGKKADVLKEDIEDAASDLKDDVARKLKGDG